MTSIEITVKTLDSRNHKFDVSEELTVKQFKEKIAEIVGVTADTQRLIYCGRVLQDDKKLSEYELNKKVVHLVQKLPPTQRPGGSGSGTSSRSSGSGHSPRGGLGGARIGPDGSMYLGALAFPSDISPQDSQGVIQSATQSRLSLVQSMLRRAESCVHRLEDPNAQRSASPTNSNSSSAGEDHTLAAEVEATITTAVPIDGPHHIHHHTHNHSIPTEALSGAVSAAVAGALTAIASAMRPGNITVLHPASGSFEHLRQQGSGSNNGSGGSERSQQQNNERRGTSSDSNSANNSQSTAPSDNRSPSGDQNSRPDRPAAVPVNAIADALDEVLHLQDRLRPFLQRTTEVLRADTPFQADSPELQEAQRTFSLVSEVLHLLSHAYHSLSDLHVSLAQQPPRNVYTRSLVVQPAAVLQAGFPIQAQINVMSNQSGSATSSPSHQPNAPANTSSPGTPTVTATTTTTTPPLSERMTMNAMPGFSLPSGGNLEFIMEVGPTSFTLEQASISPVHSTSTTSSSSPPTGQSTPRPNMPGITVRPMGGIGMAPPPELIQSIMNAMASQVMGGNSGGAIRLPQAFMGASTTSTQTQTQTTTSSQGTPPNLTGQTSQARGNTATHPTTSTQTRSTARPHVHLAPLGWPGPQGFDPFLPCSSHHIHSQLRLQSQRIHASRIPAETQQAGPRTATFNLGPAGFMNLAQQIFGDGDEQNFMNLTSETTIADFLSTMPDYNYSQGESFFTDLSIAVARHLTFRDLVQVSLQQSAPLNRLREPLRRFVNENMLRGDAPTSENLIVAVNRFMQELTPYLQMMHTSQMRPDVDFQASISRFCMARVPELLRLIVNNDVGASDFGSELMRLSGLFVRDLASLTLLCCNGGRQGLERILQRYVQILTGDLEPSIQQWTAANSRLPFRTFVQGLAPATDAVQAFLVLNNTSAPLPASAPPTSTPTAPELTPVHPTPVVEQEEAMECDEEFVLALEDQPLQTTSTSSMAPVQTEASGLPLPTMEVETSCDVVVGSEEWHSGIETDWVPVITRDMQRQRRQSEQPPFSDAYLAGMSSKRRKIISNNKPQGTVGQVISDSISQAAGAAGVSNTEQLAIAAGRDTALQSAYKEEVKKLVSQELASNPDFTPERYPNASKYFNPRK